MAPLTADELQRYDRHIKLPEVGVEGQEKLKAASVLLIGAGGLGSPISMYLAAAGIGRIGIIDHDEVDSTNLQRQIVHSTAEIGVRKVDSARARLESLNPFVDVETHDATLSVTNALALIAGYDIVVDGSDNFATRYLVNDACVLLNKPNVHGAIFKFEGQASLFHPPAGPCYRCIFPEPPPPGTVPSCEEGGVFGVLPGVIGCIQATEVIKLVTGLGETLLGRLVLYDALAMQFRQIRIERNEHCAMCGDTPTITTLRAETWDCELPDADTTITPDTLLQRLVAGGSLRLVDVREQHEWDGGHLAGAQHIPLGAISTRHAEISKDAAVVVYCRSGARSARAAAWLREHGYSSVLNLEGGITRWLRENGSERIE